MHQMEVEWRNKADEHHAWISGRQLGAVVVMVELHIILVRQVVMVAVTREFEQNGATDLVVGIPAVGRIHIFIPVLIYFLTRQHIMFNVLNRF